MECTLLRCEYRSDPLSIDLPKPRLSWVLSSQERGQKQSAYRILVASEERLLDAEQGDWWDSGKVMSGEQCHIPYAGKPLKSRARCYWRVRAWDGRGAPSRWSETALWTMGLLEDSDWEAQWIGYDAPIRRLGRTKRSYTYTPGKLSLPPPRYLRQTFSARGKIRRATLYATALGVYEARINGQKVGSEYLLPGWTDYHKRVYYDAWDVTRLIGPGGNALGVILADGWYAGYVGPCEWRHLYGKNTRVRLQLELEREDGSREMIVTDRSWKAATGPLLHADILMGEAYDARREMPGWDTPEFDDARWKPANVTLRVPARVQARPHPPVREFSRLKAVAVAEPRKGVYVFDLGQTFAGFVQIKVRARRGKRIVIRHAEWLNRDGTVCTKNLRLARSTDEYVCAGKGVETWHPRFTFHSFRYVEIRGLETKPALDAVEGMAVSSDVRRTGRFECSDSMANRLYSNIWWTERGNFIDVPTDCPNRDERLGWTGDAQIYIRTAAYNSDVSAFFSKWLTDLDDAQRPDGAITDVAPAPHMAWPMRNGAAGWAEAVIICPWALYQAYGDKEILRRHYKAMTRWIACCRRYTDATLTRHDHRSASGYGDWLCIKPNTPSEIISAAYHAHAADLMRAVAETLDKRADAARYRRLFGQLKAAFNNAFVTPDGRIWGETQTAMVLALAFDLLPEDKVPLVLDRLVADIRRRGWSLSTGFLGTKDILPTLTRYGRWDVAHKLFENKGCPSWRYPVINGATSIWERWDAWTAERGFQDQGMNSFMHYAFGAVGEWMFDTIAGIGASDPGFSHILIRPRLGRKLRWARASYDSIRGRITTSWKLRRQEFTLDVTIPPNTTATIFLPAKNAADVRESGKPIAESQGVRCARAEGGKTVAFEAGSGTYRFTCESAGATWPA